MKKAYSRPAAAQVALAAEGQLLIASGPKYTIDSTGSKKSNVILSQRRPGAGMGNPLGNSGSK